MVSFFFFHCLDMFQGLILKILKTRNLLLYPKGNNHNDTVSLYLALNSLTKEVEDEDFHVCAQFLMLISSPEDPTTFIHHGMYHSYTETLLCYICI